MEPTGVSNMQYKICYKNSKKSESPFITIRTGRASGMSSENMPGNIIVDSLDIDDLLKFVNNAIEKIKEEDEHWTTGYTAKVVEKYGKKMIKIFFRLTDDYEPYYIDPKEFKELIEVWIKEKEKFDADPEKYKEELKKRGGEVIEE